MSSRGVVPGGVIPAPPPRVGVRPVYDSADTGSPVLGQLRELWELRRLLRIVVARDVIVRYKRSLLGVWWTLLNPLLTVAVMWAVLSGIFHARSLGVPYIVYLLSGVLLINFFQQGVIAAGWSMAGSSGVISKVHVPPALFALSAVLAAGVTLIVSVGLLLVMMLATGVGMQPSALLVPVPLLALAMLGTGCGLLLAAAAVRVHDVIDFTQVALQLLAFVTPTFYLLSSVSEPMRTAVQFNPLTQILLLFRGLLWGSGLPPWWTWAASAGSGAVALGLGTVVLARTWRASAAML